MNRLIFILLILLPSACEKTTPVYQKLSDEAVILAFGDSLTYGTGASEAADYPNILSQLSQRTIINAGIAGETTQTGLYRLPELLIEHQPELLILIHGGNDILRKIPEDKITNNLKQMIQLAQQQNIKVIMLGVPEPKLFNLTSAAFYQQVATDLNIPIDLDTIPEILGNNRLKSDTIHPNDQGYQLMAKNIYQLLQTSGAL